MEIFLITIGSELLNGKVCEINTDTLGKISRYYKFKLKASLAIRDDKVEIENALNKTSAKTIIISGGLGPTKDDITESILTQKYGAPSERLINHNGVAQGLVYQKNEQTIIATPGVPSEFKMMIEKEVLSFLKVSRHEDSHLIFKTHGIGESKIFNELDKDLWKQLESFGEVSCLPIPLGVDIGVKLNNSQDRDQLIKIIQNSPLKEFLWHIGEESIEELIIQEAKNKNLKVGFAESCTGGLLAHRITNVAGSSAVFWGSIISYSNEVKMRVLNVKEQSLKDFGAVSTQVAQEMAQGALENMNCDIVVTTTGIAGPGGGSEEKPVGTVCIGVATKKASFAKRYNFNGSRDQLKERFANKALHTLLNTILEK